MLALRFCLFFFFFSFSLGFNGDEHFSELVEDAVMVQRNAILKTLREANSPFKKIHECIRGGDLYSKPSTKIEEGTTMDKIRKSGKLNIGNVRGYSEREEYNVIVKNIISYFTNELYLGVTANVIYYKSGTDMIDALLSGEIDLVHPGFYVDSFVAKRLKTLHPVCTAVGFDFAYYVSETVPGKGSPFKNMKELVDEALSSKKKIAVFDSEVDTVLRKMYPQLGLTVVTVLEKTTADLDLLGEYIAVFAATEYDADKLAASNVALLKNYFVLPLMMYSRVERPYIVIPEDVTQKIHYTGNVALRQLIDHIVFNLQKGNAHFSYSITDRTVSIGDCVANEPELPEVIKIGGTLQRIKGESQIKVGYLPSESTLLRVRNDSDNGIQIEGDFFAMEQKIFTKLGKYLKINELKVVPCYFETAEELFYALDKGEIDVTSGSLLSGGSVKGLERRWLYEYTCATSGWPLVVYTPKGKDGQETIYDLTTLKAYLKASPTAKIAVANPEMSDVIRDTFDMEVKTKVIGSSSEAFAKVVEQTEYIAYVPEYITEIPDEYVGQIKKIVSGDYVTTAMFMRKDRKNVQEDKGVSLAAVVFTIALIVLLILLIGFVLMMVRRQSMMKKIKQQHIEIVDEDAPEKRLLDAHSIGDEDDPDYVAPSF